LSSPEKKNEKQKTGNGKRKTVRTVFHFRFAVFGFLFPVSSLFWFRLVRVRIEPMASRIWQGDPEGRPVLTLVTRKGCGLCDEMKELVDAIAPEFGCLVELRDIEAAPQLESQFSDEVPVLFVNGRKAFKYRVTARQLRRRLTREIGPWHRGLVNILR
jgi:glutaredoxin